MLTGCLNALQLLHTSPKSTKHTELHMDPIHLCVQAVQCLRAQTLLYR